MSYFSVFYLFAPPPLTSSSLERLLIVFIIKEQHQSEFRMLGMFVL